MHSTNCSNGSSTHDVPDLLCDNRVREGQNRRQGYDAHISRAALAKHDVRLRVGWGWNGGYCSGGDEPLIVRQEVGGDMTEPYMTLSLEPCAVGCHGRTEASDSGAV